MNIIDIDVRHNFSKIVLAIIPALAVSIVILKTGGDIVWTVFFISMILGCWSIWAPVIIHASFIVATLLVPNEILPALSGSNELYGFGVVKLHPAAITVFVGSLLNIISRRHVLIGRVRSSRALASIFILFVIFLISIFVQTLPLGGLKGLPQCLENYLFPFSYFMYMLTLDKKTVLNVVRCFFIIIPILAVYGILEYILGFNPAYDNLYSKPGMDWYLGDLSDSYRIKTLIGHPLKNALYFLFLVPISMQVLKKPFNFVVIAVLIFAILATGSRSAFLLCVLAIVFWHTKVRFLKIYEVFKKILIMSIIGFIIYLALFYSNIGQNLLRRFGESRYSMLVRLQSLEGAPNLISENFICGKGIGLSFKLSSDLFGVNRIGFENPWVMLIVDVGFVTAMLYFVTIFVTLWSKRRYFFGEDTFDRSAYISFFCILLMASSFNSFGARDTINFLIWFNMALLWNPLGEASKNELMDVRGLR